MYAAESPRQVGQTLMLAGLRGGEVQSAARKRTCAEITAANLRGSSRHGRMSSLSMEALGCRIRLSTRHHRRRRR